MADPKRIFLAVGRVLAADHFHGLTAIVTDDLVVAGQDAMAAPAVKRHCLRRNGFGCHGVSQGPVVGLITYTEFEAEKSPLLTRTSHGF